MGSIVPLYIIFSATNLSALMNGGVKYEHIQLVNPRARWLRVMHIVSDTYNFNRPYTHLIVIDVPLFHVNVQSIRQLCEWTEDTFPYVYFKRCSGSNRVCTDWCIIKNTDAAQLTKLMSFFAVLEDGDDCPFIADKTATDVLNEHKHTVHYGYLPTRIIDQVQRI